MNKLEETLSKLGLTKQEAQIYLSLTQRGPQTAMEIAKETSILPNAIYRTAYRLSQKGFVTIVEKYPTEFAAINLQTAAPISVGRQVHQLQNLLTNIQGGPLNIKPSSHPTEVQLIYGAENIFEEAAKLLDLAKQEMLVISIGEPIPPNLLLSVRKAKERNVSIRMIAHKYDESNKDVLENLKKNGYEIRHYPDWGFHMAIYDQVKTLLIINNPENTSERVAMFSNSSGLSKALHDYFISVWKKAKVV